MTNIKFEDIDFSKLSKLEDVCSTNDVYLFENKIIKIFKKYKGKLPLQYRDENKDALKINN